MARVLKSPIPYRAPSTENLIELIYNGLQKHSDQILLIDSGTGRSWSGKEIESVLSRLVKYLVEECNMKKGDRCSIYGDTNDAIILLNLAVIVAGGTVIYLTNNYRPRELRDVVRTTKARFLIASQQLLQASHVYMREFDDSIHAISYDEACDGYKNGCKLIGHLLVKDSTGPSYTSSEIVQRTNIIPDYDIAVIQFSSGTTGRPKPIPRTHKNLCHLVASVDHEELMDLKPGVVIAGSLPVTHRPGLWALLACINGGSTFVLWCNLSDVGDALKTIEKYKVTIFSSSLPFLAMLGNIGVKSKHRFDLKSLKHIITSGAKIVNADLPNLLIKEFNLLSLRQCFGMTEAGWLFLIENSLAKDNYLSVGHICPGMEAMIVDRETGKPVGVDSRGEIIVRGPQLFKGYITCERNIFIRNDFTDCGWFKTGDQAYYDPRELVYIEGRYKELLCLRNNSRFFPNEIEAIISEHPSVEGVCVVKVGEYREAIVYDIARAYVTVKRQCQLTEEELMVFIAERSFEALLDGGIRFLDQFPRLDNGKVDKLMLKEMI